MISKKVKDTIKFKEQACNVARTNSKVENSKIFNGGKTQWGGGKNHWHRQD